MSIAVENLLKAQQFAMSIRPKVGGFPYLAEALRRAGITLVNAPESNKFTQGENYGFR